MRQWVLAGVLSALMVGPGQAQIDYSKLPAGYQVAESIYNELTLEQRVRLQLMMTAAGYWNGVPNEDLNPRFFEAMSRYQNANGFAATGMLTADQVRVLGDMARPNFQHWGFERIRHPWRNVSVWVPKGLGLIEERTQTGVKFTTPNNLRGSSSEVYLELVSHPRNDSKNMGELLAQKLMSDGFQLQYKVLRDNFFVLSLAKGGSSFYVRMHVDGTNLTGFLLGWRNYDAPLYGERMMTLISGSLYAESRGWAFLSPPVWGNAYVASAPTTTVPYTNYQGYVPVPTEVPTAAPSTGCVARTSDDCDRLFGGGAASAPADRPWEKDPIIVPAPKPAPQSGPVEVSAFPIGPGMAAPAPKVETAPIGPGTTPKEEEDETTSSGTGFFVNWQGHIVTNNHVVEACKKITVAGESFEPITADVVRLDAKNDLAVLRANVTPKRYIQFGDDPRLGEQVAAFGYPLSHMLSKSGNFTMGHVTARNGLGDDARYLQMSAAVQAGNSGGVLLNEKGMLLGVVTAKLNAMKVFASTGDIPQNVNFAIKARLVTDLLTQANVMYSPNLGGDLGNLSSTSLAELATQASVHILCE